MNRTCTSALTALLWSAACSLGWSQMIDRTDSRVQTTLNTGWKCLGVVRPRGVGDITAGQNWALGCETLCRDYIYWDTYKDYVAPLGIKTIRLQGGWAKTEKVQGVYDFGWLDYVIDDALSKGLEIWLETDYGNPMYEGAGTADLGAGFPTSEVGLAAWDRWVEAMATRYQDKVKKWAMWNEPDIGVSKTPEMIANFNIRTAQIIKRTSPDARIGALSLARIQPQYLDQCLKVIADRGKLDLFEWVIYHGYTKNPDDAYKNVEAMKEVVAKYEPRLKMWQGENGCPSERATKFALSGHDWSELTQAKWNTRRMLGDLGHDCISSVFTICDFDHAGREINRKGLLKINDKRNLAKVKMAYYAVQNVVSVFDDNLVRRKDYACTIECEQPITWFAYRNEKAASDVLVFWNGTTYPLDTNDTLPATIRVEGGKFADPVWADLITGRIYEIPEDCRSLSEGKMVLKKIPTYDAPALIADRNILLTNSSR
ncbi:MAG: beta-galactosidase [Pirellulales bacterium]|nr:beta-galactosidase [Pirellulales bacterium]